MEANISFGPVTSHDQVPSALNYLIDQVESLNKKLLERAGSLQEPDIWFNLEEFCNYHPAKPAPTTVYGWVHRRIVPHKYQSKHLIFLKSEIDAWLKSKTRSTSDQLVEAAERHTTRQRRGGRQKA